MYNEGIDLVSFGKKGVEFEGPKAASFFSRIGF